MNKSYLKQMITNINKVNDTSEKINTLEDKRLVSEFSKACTHKEPRMAKITTLGSL